jgi:small subunit ribosomal protein S8
LFGVAGDADEKAVICGTLISAGFASESLLPMAKFPELLNLPGKFMTDTISDMLTRIRNSLAAKKTEVAMPYSKFKHSLAKVLQQEGWIKNIDIKEEGRIKNLSLVLKYDEAGLPAISGLKRVSKPGQRIYADKTAIPKVLGGLGTTIVSTSKGLMTDKLARKEKVGGEVICQIW